VDTSVEVRYAGVVVGRGLVLRDQSPEGTFVGIPEPLPVGTLVTLKVGDTVREARVDEVVESAEPSTAGMRVRWGGEARATAPAPQASQPAAAPSPAVAPAAPAPAPAPAAAGAPVAVTPAPAEASGAIPAPLSLANAADSGQHGGGKKRRKRR
jgi:2-oxoglutarate dehydrogenase E2 component (dihydrolipoamide succinyltransferase)